MAWACRDLRPCAGVIELQSSKKFLGRFQSSTSIRPSSPPLFQCWASKVNLYVYMNCGESNIIWTGGQGGRGTDKQRPQHTKVKNVPLSLFHTHFLLPCWVTFLKHFFDDCSLRCVTILRCLRFETKVIQNSEIYLFLTSSTLLPIVGDVWTTSLIKLQQKGTQMNNRRAWYHQENKVVCQVISVNFNN